MQGWLDFSRSRALVFGLALSAAAPACFADLIVRVSGIQAQRGHVGCALFSSGAGFPMDNVGRPQDWPVVDGKSVTCRFRDVADGNYAVSVVHDLNDNRKLDTNFLGLPAEPWGVSNNVRPSLRAPKFDEARFTVESGHDVTVDVRVAQ